MLNSSDVLDKHLLMTIFEVLHCPKKSWIKYRIFGQFSVLLKR